MSAGGFKLQTSHFKRSIKCSSISASRSAFFSPNVLGNSLPALLINHCLIPTVNNLFQPSKLFPCVLKAEQNWA